MYQLDFNTCSAIDIIKRSETCHPSLLRDALAETIDNDKDFAYDRPKSMRPAIFAHAKAAQKALDALDNDNLETLKTDMGAGIIALNIACRLQCIPPHVRTASAVRTWENN